MKKMFFIIAMTLMFSGIANAANCNGLSNWTTCIVEFGWENDSTDTCLDRKISGWQTNCTQSSPQCWTGSTSVQCDRYKAYCATNASLNWASCSNFAIFNNAAADTAHEGSVDEDILNE